MDAIGLHLHPLGRVHHRQGGDLPQEGGQELLAAGLDVFENEPNIHPGYRDLTNVFLLPHLGSATVDTRNAMGFKALDNLDAFFAGRELPDRLV